MLYGFSRKLESGKTELITFSLHTAVASGGATALVPLVAEYREDGMLTFEARARRATDLQFNSVLAGLDVRAPEVGRLADGASKPELLLRHLADCDSRCWCLLPLVASS